MTIKKTLFLLIAVVLVGMAQTAAAQNKQKTFTGAEASLDHYKALYMLNSSDEKKISGTLRNIKNALNDPRLKGKVEIELIVFGDGVGVYAKEGPYEEKLKELQNMGVLLAQCENTLRERKIDKSSLFSFISFVPSAAGEIIIRQQQGWAVVHP